MNIISLTVKNATKVCKKWDIPFSVWGSCALQTPPCCFSYTILETPQKIFCLRSCFLWRLVSVLFSFKLLHGSAHTLVTRGLCIRHLRTCTVADKTLPSQSSPQKNHRMVKSQLRLKRSSKELSPENFLATCGYLEHNTYRVTALA